MSATRACSRSASAGSAARRRSRSRARASRALGVADDDVVELTNLHRQILFADADVGAPKVDALRRRRFARRAPSVALQLDPRRASCRTTRSSIVARVRRRARRERQLRDAVPRSPTPARSPASPSCTRPRSAGRRRCSPSGARGRPCYRCLFEDVPDGDAPDCAEAGVIGPVCGVVGALAGRPRARASRRATRRRRRSSSPSTDARDVLRAAPVRAPRRLPALRRAAHAPSARIEPERATIAPALRGLTRRTSHGNASSAFPPRSARSPAATTK